MKFLKPTKGKIILTIIIMIIYYFIISAQWVMCKACPPEWFCQDSWPEIVQTCDCCVTFSEFMSQLFYYIIIPLIIIYLISCLIFYIFKRGKK